VAQWETRNPVGTLPAVDVVLHAVTTINAHPRAPNDKSAYELLFGRQPSLPPAVHLRCESDLVLGKGNECHSTRGNKAGKED
jgi:hypothetical protein